MLPLLHTLGRSGDRAAQGRFGLAPPPRAAELGVELRMVVGRQNLAR